MASLGHNDLTQSRGDAPSDFLFCCGYIQTGFLLYIWPNSSCFLHWHYDNCISVPVSVKLPWMIRVKTTWMNLYHAMTKHDKVQTMYIIIGKYCTSGGCLPLILCWVIYSAENAYLDPSQSWPVILEHMQAGQSPPYPSFCDLRPYPLFCDLHRMLAVVIRCHCPGKGTGSVSVLWYSEKVMSICQVRLLVGHVSLWWLWHFFTVLHWCFVC